MIQFFKNIAGYGFERPLISNDLSHFRFNDL